MPLSRSDDERIRDGLSRSSSEQSEHALTSVFVEWLEARKPFSLEDLRHDYPRELPRLWQALRRAIDVTVPSRVSVEEIQRYYPELEQIRRYSPDDVLTGSQLNVAEPTATKLDCGQIPIPESLKSKYTVRNQLGSGGFGIVVRALHRELNQNRAIKRIAISETRSPISRIQQEARILAGLEHPSIVRIYDIERPGDGFAYIISEYVDGENLAHAMRRARYEPRAAAMVVRTIAEALDYAHQRGIVHRDIKAANILLRGDGRPVLADFGMAFYERDEGHGQTFAGTLPYMSPEQVRGEGHRVGRASDIYSLGVVLFELLTGTRPFANDSQLVQQILYAEIPRPRSIDPRIPRELERICLKALARQVRDRYSSARELAADLQHWEASQHQEPLSAASGRMHFKGLLGFDRADASFFPRLLPGLVDRDGLPEILSNWKRRVESRDEETSCRVAVFLGPSGSGKSSLIRAGLIPQLNPSVVTSILLDSRSQALDQRAARRLRDEHGVATNGNSLAELLRHVREQKGLPGGQKLLLVFDQFEQWLSHFNPQSPDPIVDAMRQCDGANVQAIVVARDDFTLSVTQWMDLLEEPLRQDRNFVAVEPFSDRHATFVLENIGRALGVLPDQPSAEQRAFLQEVVLALQADGPLLPVRLALLASMLKDRPWVPSTLRAMGGVKGLGVAFLEEKLIGPTAHPHLRAYPDVVRRLLEQLLPDGGAMIRGAPRTGAELENALAPVARPETVEKLLGILDEELRLVTVSASPRVGEQSSALSGSKSGSRPHEPSYQLTHDYLVPAVREWLARHEWSTRSGRARRRLKELSESWSGRRGNRNLPNPIDYIWIRSVTRRNDWNESQRQMMDRATVYHGVRTAVLIVVAAMLLASTQLFWSRHQQGLAAERDRVAALTAVDAAQKVVFAELPATLAEIRSRAALTEPLVELRLAESKPNDSPHDIRLPLASVVLGHDDRLPDILRILPQLGPLEIQVVREVLKIQLAADSLARLRQLAESEFEATSSPRELRRRLGLAVLLADLAADDEPFWTRNGAASGAALIAAGSEEPAAWAQLLIPVRQYLLDTIVADLNRQGDQPSVAGDSISRLQRIEMIRGAWVRRSPAPGVRD